ncbi:MAG: uracil-DNA glycosylase family protein [Patescibacteria group bacterium]
MDLSEKTKKLKKIKKEVINLKDSPLYNYRKDNDYFPVLGEGNHDADLMLIGEAPGENEAKTGRPFCGRAGQILDEMLDEVGIDRQEAYVTNIVKDRPPENRDPSPNEITLYGPFLDQQIKIIEPKIIATLGRFSANYILKKFSFGKDFSISKINGNVFEKDDLPFKIIPLFHPAATIYTRSRRDDLLEDFKLVKELLNNK